MRDYIRLAGTLMVVCIVAAALLGFTNDFTKDKIAMQIALANDEARKQVLPTAETFEKIDDANLSELKNKADFDTVLEIYEAKKAGTTIGYAMKVGPKGYAGPVEIMVGVDTNGVIQGIKVGTNTETPGLGKNAENPTFQKQFKDKSWDTEIKVIKNGTPKDDEIVALSGATITSRAVTNGVNQAAKAAKELSGK